MTSTTLAIVNKIFAAGDCKDPVTGEALPGEPIKVFLNQAPERDPGTQAYIVFAFRSEVSDTAFDGVNAHRAIETVDLILYRGGPRKEPSVSPEVTAARKRAYGLLVAGRVDEATQLRAVEAITCLEQFLQRLGPALSAMSGLETGVTENGYNFARRRLTINPHR